MTAAAFAMTVDDEPRGNAPLQPRAPALTCRRMTDADIDEAVCLLSAGFPERCASYWHQGFDRLRTRAVPEGCPRYGYVLTDQAKLVGIVLVIFAATDTGSIRGNVSSWYVEPPYRGYSHLLLAAPLKMKDVTLVNISPAPTTLETIAAQGFTRYVGGTFITLAAIARPVFGAHVRRLATADQARSSVLRDHTKWKCLTLEVSYAGEVHPFVFVAQRFIGGSAPCAQLVYCRSVEDFVRFAGPLGRCLLRHGFGAVLVDANGRLDGVPGVYRPGRGPKFSRGKVKPRICDLSYTELAIFGP